MGVRAGSGAALSYEYEFSFAQGLGAWASWMPNTLVQDVEGEYPDYVRLQAPGQLDPNHLDGIGALWLVAHLNPDLPGAVGSFDLRDAEISLTVRGRDFNANGARLVFWICSTLPDGSTTNAYLPGLQISNWANVGNDLAPSITEDWQTLKVQLSVDPSDWEYAGNYTSGQGDWADRYAFLDLDAALSSVNSTLHLVLVGDSPEEEPQGFLEIANLQIDALVPASTGNQAESPAIFYGVEDEPTTGMLATPDGFGSDVHFAVVEGSVRNGQLVLDEATGRFSFAAAPDFWTWSGYREPAEFTYVVRDGERVAERRAVLFLAGVNDAPLTDSTSEDLVVANNRQVISRLRAGWDPDGDSLRFAIVEGSVRGGNVELDPRSGRYVFTPEPGYSGSGGFDYFVTDGQQNSTTKTLELTIGDSAALGEPLGFVQIIDRYLTAGDLDGFVKYTALLAEGGDPIAAYHLGSWLSGGRFFARDTTDGARFLDLASPFVPEAEMELVPLLLSGDGVAQDYARAREILANRPGDPAAKYRLALLLEEGLGGPADQAEAIALFLEAAKAGNVDAAYTLGRRYLLGEGVAESAEDAYFWLGVSVRSSGQTFTPGLMQQLQYNFSQAAALLEPDRRAVLDAEIGGWQPGRASPVNDKPVTGGEEQAFVYPDEILRGLVSPGSDPDGDRTRFLLIGSENGVVELDERTGAYTFAPDRGFVGEASFRYVLFDGEARGEPQTVRIAVTLTPPGVTLTGSDGDDDLVGGFGPDILTGLAGRDRLFGGNGAVNQLQGGADDDEYYVTAAGDLVVEAENEGVDTVRTTLSQFALPSAVERLIFEGSGAFVGIGNAGDNLIRGAGGDDRLAGLAGNDHLDGGDGLDLADYSTAPGAVSINLRSGVALADGAGGTDTLVSIEAVAVSGSGAVVIGSDGGNLLLGGRGRDVLIGLNGDDVLVGGPGSANQMQGGKGDDVYEVSATGDTLVELPGEGTDKVQTTLNIYSLTKEIEQLAFVGNGSFHGFGNELDNSLTGGSADDLLDGRGGNNMLDGGPGFDVADYRGAPSAVEVNLSAGRADRNGYGGSDRLIGIEGVQGPKGGSLLIGDVGANALYGGIGRDVLISLEGDDILSGGSDAANELYGGAGDDTYIVRAAGDTIVERAGEGVDLVQTTLQEQVLADHVENVVFVGSGSFAGRGNGLDNQLRGGSGADRLSGSGGRDQLIGGGGADVFVYDHAADSTAAAHDLIIDFKAGEDRIDLSQIDADPASAARDPFTLLSNSPFSARSSELRVRTDGQDTFVEADLDGDGSADIVIQLAGLHALSAQDFIFG